jgi:hypothetical protein
MWVGLAQRMSFSRSFVHSAAFFAILCDTPFLNVQKRKAFGAFLARVRPLEEEGCNETRAPKRRCAQRDNTRLRAAGMLVGADVRISY